MEKIVEFMKIYSTLDVQEKNRINSVSSNVFKVDFLLTLGKHTNTGVDNIDTFFRMFKKTTFNEKEKETFILLRTLTESENLYKKYDSIANITGQHPCFLFREDFESIHKNIHDCKMRETDDDFTYTKLSTNYLLIHPYGSVVKFIIPSLILDYSKNISELIYFNVKTTDNQFFLVSEIQRYFDVAAWIFVNILKLRPWVVGNIEMAFILANHILQHIVPVPVMLQENLCFENCSEEEILLLYINRVCDIWNNILI